MQLGQDEEFVQFPRPCLYHLLNTAQESVLVPDVDQLRRFQPGLDKEVRHTNPTDPPLFLPLHDHPLRPQAWEHPPQRVEQVRHQSHRCGQRLFPVQTALHIHPVQVLPGTRNHPRDYLHQRHWCVVLWLYFGLALYRLPPVPRWELELADAHVHGDPRPAPSLPALSIIEEKEVLHLELWMQDSPEQRQVASDRILDIPVNTGSVRSWFPRPN